MFGGLELRAWVSLVLESAARPGRTPRRQSARAVDRAGRVLPRPTLSVGSVIEWNLIPRAPRRRCSSSPSLAA